MVPVMFRVGRHEYVVRSPKEFFDRSTAKFVEQNINNCDKEREPDYMYFSNVSDIRPEEVHPFVKYRANNKIVRSFDKEKSVFQPWKELTLQTKDQAFGQDLDNTKLSKLIKNADDVSANSII